MEKMFPISQEAAHKLYESLKEAVAYVERTEGKGMALPMGARIGAVEIGACWDPTKVRFDLDKARDALDHAQASRLP